MLSTVMVCLKSSPRPWRCFLQRILERDARGVFSTPVEVFPSNDRAKAVQNGLLHARGGVSPLGNFRERERRSSPRPWRCFRKDSLSDVVIFVFSTPVEVFLGRGRAD